MRTNRLKKSLKVPAIFDITNLFGPDINESLTFKVPYTRVALNKDLDLQIKKMKSTAAHFRMGYLTANYVQSFHRVCLINRNLNQLHISNANYNKPEDYQVFVNPQIIEGKGQLEQFEEQCLTFPFMKFKVNRFKEIMLKFRDQEKEYRQELFDGFTSQLIQHCISHLDGQLLMDYKLSHGKFYMSKQTVQYFPKTSFLLREYSLRLKNHHSLMEKGQTTQLDPQFVDMKSDYIFRLKNEYTKESRQFSNRIENRRFELI